MSDAFHRLVAPTYFTGGPTFPSESGVTYDYINNGGSGTPAFADTAKVGGPNAGTLFSAFGEDATSSNINRGNLALSQNCDHLDNLLHRSIASPVRTNDTTPGSPVTTITLPTSTFLGMAGYTSSVADLNRLFEITDSNDQEISVSDVKVVVSSVTLGSGDAIGGGGANGSFSGNTVQLNIAPSIPNGTTYRVYYGTRSNLATLPLDALTSIKIRGADEVSNAVEAVLADLHGNNGKWNDSWLSSIYTLVTNGLHARYMRASSNSVSSADVPPTSEVFWPAVAPDTKGSGGFVIRRGPAVTVYTEDSGLYADPLNALFAAKFYDQTATSSGGPVGVAVYGARRSATAYTGETGGYTPGAGSFSHLWPHRFDSSLSISTPKTRVVAGTAALFNLVGAYNVDSGEAIVQLTASNNYYRAGGVSAVNIGYDLLECTHPVGINTVTRTYVIVGHGSSATPTDTTKVRVRNLDGTVPDFSTPVTGTVRWISSSFWLGDGAAEYHSQAHSDVKPSLLSGLFFQVPQLLSTSSDDDVPRVPASFSAQTNAAVAALRWGGFNPTDSVSAPVWGGSLMGDGSIRLTGSSTSAGNITLSSGSLAVSAGTMISSGNIQSTGGNITASAGNISAGGNTAFEGGVTANVHVTNIQALGTFSSPSTINCPSDSGSFMTMVTPLNGQALTINLTGLRTGQVVRLLFDHTTDSGNGPPALTWAGAGLTHNFSGGATIGGPGDGQLGPDTGYTLYVGAVTGTTVFWTATRY